MADSNSIIRNSRPRVGGKTFEQRVYEHLRRADKPLTVRDVAGHFCCTVDSASKACLRLKWKGCAKAHGRSTATAYSATAVRPEDLRGLSVGSMTALRNIHPMKVCRPATRKPHARPGTTLEKFWPMKASA